jgi:hypothetical protein
VRAVAVALLAGMLALPGVALAAPPPSSALTSSGPSPLTPGVPQSPAPTTPTPTPAPTVVNPTTTTSGDSGLSGPTALIIAVGALIILAGISFYIWHDARRRAPVRHRTAAAEAEGGPRAGSKARTKQRKLSPAERRRRKRGRAR